MTGRAAGEREKQARRDSRRRIKEEKIWVRQ